MTVVAWDGKSLAVDKQATCADMRMTTTKACRLQQGDVVALVFDRFMAWGSGRDFAMGAMEMGASAYRAVEVAIRHSTGCGYGIDLFDF